MCISHALSMPLSFWAAMNPEGRDKIISVTIVHLTAQQGENHYYCAEQIREKVKGKKKRIHTVLVVMWHYSSLEEKVKITLTRLS